MSIDPTTWRSQVLTSLNPEQIAAVTGLAETEMHCMGEEPLSDAARLTLVSTGSESDSGTEATWHGLVWMGTDLVAYLQVRTEGPDHVAELAASDRVQRGDLIAGTLRDIRQRVGMPITLWVRGDDDPAGAVASQLEMRPLRTLLQLRAQLGPVAAASEQTPAPRCPPGFSLRTFQAGVDDDAWLAINAAAFVQLPDQGGWTRADLTARLAAPWFRPEGFFLVVAPDDDIAGFHWTKIQPGADCGCAADCGEIYVLGVSPRYQGHGLGAYLTVVGLDYFRALGITTAMLYVDESNTSAIKTYARRGFTIFATSRQFLMA